MPVPLQTLALLIAAAFCFREIAVAPKGAEPGPWLVAVFGILLLRRALIQVKQPVAVIVSGCLLTAFLVVSDRGLLNANTASWIAIMLVGMACFGFWERIEKLWK